MSIYWTDYSLSHSETNPHKPLKSYSKKEVKAKALIKETLYKNIQLRKATNILHQALMNLERATVNGNEITFVDNLSSLPKTSACNLHDINYYGFEPSIQQFHTADDCQISVQVGAGNYCSPRANLSPSIIREYTTCEIMWQSPLDDCLDEKFKQAIIEEDNDNIISYLDFDELVEMFYIHGGVKTVSDNVMHRLSIELPLSKFIVNNYKEGLEPLDKTNRAKLLKNLIDNELNYIIEKCDFSLNSWPFSDKENYVNYIYSQEDLRLFFNKIYNAVYPLNSLGGDLDGDVVK